MYRIFKKEHDLAARDAEGRARRPRRQRLGLEALEGRQLMSLGLNDFLVNVNTSGSQFFSDNASSANGMHVAVWGTNGFGDSDIHGQLYNARKASGVGSELTIAASGSFEQNPHAAMDANGNFVVTFEKTVNGQTDIIARRFSSGGGSLGETVVANDPSRSEHDADVAMDASGNFVVSYTFDFNAGDKDLRAKRFNSSGVQADTFVVSQSSDFDETRSSVAMTPDGRFDIAYQFGFHGGGGERIHVARYNSGGTQPTSDQQIFTQNSPSRNPSVAMDNAGNAVVAYQTVHFGGTGQFNNLFDIDVARVNSAGAVVSTHDITGTGNAAPPVNNVLPSIALAPTGGSYVVGYQADFSDGSRNVAVAEVNGSDTIVGALGLPTSPKYTAAALSIAGNGKYLFTFDAFDSGGADRNIHGRFGQLPVAPAAQNLALTSPIKVGQSATLSGQLVDGDGDTNLTLTVNWGDGSKVQQLKPGTKPFKMKHKFNHQGTYTVHATWTDSTGLSNSRDLTLVVNPRHVPLGPGAARFHRA